MELLNVEEKVFDVQVWDDPDADPIMFADIAALTIDEREMLIIAGPSSEIPEDRGTVPIMGVFNRGKWDRYEITSAPREKLA